MIETIGGRRVYRCGMAEIVDQIAYDIYGRHAVEVLLEANPGLASLGPILPINTIINIPDITEEPAQERSIKLWD